MVGEIEAPSGASFFAPIEARRAGGNHRATARNRVKNPLIKLNRR